MIQPLFKETNNNGPTTVYNRQRPHSTSVFLSACVHPLNQNCKMNADEEKRLLATVEEEDDSATLKPDDVRNTVSGRLVLVIRRRELFSKRT